MKFHFTTLFIFSLFLFSACEEELFTPINESIKETAQVNITSKNEMFVCMVEPQPQFPGGFVKLLEFIIAHLQFPKELRDAGIEGKAIVQFVVREDGMLDKIKVVRGVHPLLDAEAIRVIQLMPNWIPPKRYDQLFASRFILPINFSLK